jgi:ribonucleoside-triphosphate reductase
MEGYKIKKCNKKTEIYSRVVGMYQPIFRWNPGKGQEFKDRKTYQIKKEKNEKYYL